MGLPAPRHGPVPEGLWLPEGLRAARGGPAWPEARQEPWCHFHFSLSVGNTAPKAGAAFGREQMPQSRLLGLEAWVPREGAASDQLSQTWRVSVSPALRWGTTAPIHVVV